MFLRNSDSNLNVDFYKDFLLDSFICNNFGFYEIKCI